MAQKMFEYAVLYHPNPTKDQHDRGESPKSEVIVKPTTVVATTEAEVQRIASRAIPESFETENKMDLVEILIRPF